MVLSFGAAPRLVVLDGATLNPGDLSWDPLRSLANTCIWPRTPPNEVIARCQDAELVLTNKVIFNADVFAALPKLRYLGVTATGYNVVDMAAARRHGVVVTNIPAYGAASVAQFTFSLLLSMLLPIDYYRDAVRSGRWSSSSDFCFYDHTMPELEGWTLGLIGYGDIGRRVARIALGYGMKVLVHKRSPSDPLPDGIEYSGLDRLLSQSQVVSLHCPLSESTQGMVNQEFLAQMQRGAYLINTARGPLVDEHALTRAFETGHLAGAALDVLATEPPPLSQPLLRAPNCLITPHIAWATLAARQRLLDIAVKNLRDFLAGKPTNQVS